MSFWPQHAEMRMPHHKSALHFQGFVARLEAEAAELPLAALLFAEHLVFMWIEVSTVDKTVHEICSAQLSISLGPHPLSASPIGQRSHPRRALLFLAWLRCRSLTSSPPRKASNARWVQRIEGFICSLQRTTHMRRRCQTYLSSANHRLSHARCQPLAVMK